MSYTYQTNRGEVTVMNWDEYKIKKKMNKENDLFKDQLIGEEIYFGKPHDRPLPKVGDLCWCREDGELNPYEVVTVRKKTFDAKSCEGELRFMLGIRNSNFKQRD